MSVLPEDETFLRHYGVKGMKWGKRRAAAGAAADFARSTGDTKKADKLDKKANKEPGTVERAVGRQLASASARRNRIAKGTATGRDKYKELSTLSVAGLIKGKGLKGASANLHAAQKARAKRLAAGQSTFRDKIAGNPDIATMSIRDFVKVGLK